MFLFWFMQKMIGSSSRVCCIFAKATKALGKLGNIVAETFVIQLGVSSNVSRFAHPWKHHLLPGKQKCFLANSETFDVSLYVSH
jgi:hypothetical protein